MANTIRQWDVVEPGTKIRYIRKTSEMSWKQDLIDAMVKQNPSRVFTLKSIERPGAYMRELQVEEIPERYFYSKDFAVIQLRMEFTSDDLEELLSE